MSDEQLEKSKSSGEHNLLSQMVGKWEGTTRTWFEPDKLAGEAPNQATMHLILDDRFLVQDYQSSIDGNALEGKATYGYDIGLGKFQCAWMDTFHTGTNLMFSEGSRTEKGFSVLGSWHAGDQIWGWRTEVEITDKDNLTITAYNISPEGEAYKGVETIYKRKA
jgi:hypothetical protein